MGWVSRRGAPLVLTFSPSIGTWAVGTVSTLDQTVDQITFAPLGLAGELLFGPTDAQVATVQQNLTKVRDFNDYVYVHTITKLQDAIDALEEPTQDPGVGAVLALCEATVATGSSFMAAAAGAFMGTFVNGLISSWATSTPSSLDGNLLSWVNRYEATSIALDKQLAEYSSDVASSWWASFTLNGQTSVLSDLAFTDIPDAADDPSFYEMTDASMLATQQAMWKQILPDSFVALELSPLYVDGEESVPPTSWVQEYYVKHPHAYLDWQWATGIHFDEWRIYPYFLVAAPGNLTSAPLSSDACGMLFIDSTPETTINTGGLYLRNTVFGGLGIKIVGG